MTYHRVTNKRPQLSVMPVRIFHPDLQANRLYQIRIPFEAYGVLAGLGTKADLSKLPPRVAVSAKAKELIDRELQGRSVESMRDKWGGLTLSATLRKILIEQMPELEPVWAPPLLTEARVQHSLKRSKDMKAATKDKEIIDVLRKCYHRTGTPFIRAEVEALFERRGWGKP
jgi:hypothetical protein